MNSKSGLRPMAAILAAGASLLAVAVASWGGPALLGHGQGKDTDSDGIVLKTPKGGFELSGKAKLSEIGLPVYPGAKQADENDKNQGNLSVALSLLGKPDVHFLVAKFETGDSPDQVRDFYHKKLGHEVTKFTAKTKDGDMAFEIRKGDRQRKYVQIKTNDRGRTEIDLVRLDGVSDSDDEKINIE